MCQKCEKLMSEEEERKVKRGEEEKFWKRRKNVWKREESENVCKKFLA